MADANEVLDYILAELKADALLPDNHPRKMSQYMRNDLFKKLYELQKHRLQISRDGKKRHAEREARGLARPVGRPRQDLHPDTESKKFLRELDQQTKDERCQEPSTAETPTPATET